MAKGRKPTPTVIKLMTGNPGKRPIDADTLTPPIETPQPSAQLSAASRAIWDETVKELEKLRVIARIDKFQIETYCNIVARAQAIQKFLDENGMTYTTRGKHGEMVRVRPEVSILQDCEKQIRAFASEWGMTAASRARVKTDPRQGSLGLDDPTAGY